MLEAVTASAQSGSRHRRRLADLDASVVEAMLQREEALRLCAETQAAFGAVRAETDGVFRVVEALQRRVAREFGLAEKDGLVALRCAEGWVGKERAQELSLYRRHNRCVDGPLAVGGAAPLGAVPRLPSLDIGAPALDLATACSPGGPLVLVAGSHS